MVKKFSNQVEIEQSLNMLRFEKRGKLGEMPVSFHTEWEIPIFPIFLDDGFQFSQIDLQSMIYLYFSQRIAAQAQQFYSLLER